MVHMIVTDWAHGIVVRCNAFDNQGKANLCPERDRSQLLSTQG